MSCHKYFMHTQDKNKLNNIIQLYRNEGEMGQKKLGQQLLTATGKE
jgi:hypothetical protein